MTLFSKDHILGTLDVANQSEVFKVLAEHAQQLGITNNVQAIVSDYIEREDESSTGFGGGLAIPHAKSTSVFNAAVLFAKLKKPINWVAIDDKPVDTVISLLVPQGENATHLKLLSSLSRKLVHEEFVQVLRDGSMDEVFELITNALTDSEA
ncbi:PTS fructose transporter subunit IIA [Atopobium fossor]|uniref:PTS fructose transporter subunit IIA n=1 Tax=Atopobium fossor TaxID=39487 RepID=UPI000488380F|nr:PTS fructose transporter subunit IIA [Atopobium fossor]